MGVFSRWIKRGVYGALMLYLAVYPHTWGWILVGAGWTLHTAFYQAALQFWTSPVFETLSLIAPGGGSKHSYHQEDALRARALVHAYMADCDQAIDIYENQLTPWRRQNCPKLLPSGSVRYRRREVFDILRIYDTCAGQTERAFALANEAQQRLTDTAKHDQAKLDLDRKQPEPPSMSLYDCLYWLYYATEVVYREMASGAIMEAMSPIAVTHLMLEQTHEEYLSLVRQLLPNVTLSKQTVPLFQYDFQREPLLSMFFGWQMAETFHNYFPHRRRLRWILTLVGAAGRLFLSIIPQRKLDHSVGKVLIAAEQYKKPNQAWKKLIFLETARQEIVKAPTRPTILLQGIAVFLVGEAVEASVNMGYVEQVDQLVDIYVQLWKAKLDANTKMPLTPVLNETTKLKAMTPEYATTTYIEAPVKVRWAAGMITERRELDGLMLKRAQDWKRMNLTDIDFEIKSMLPHHGGEELEARYDDEF